MDKKWKLKKNTIMIRNRIPFLFEEIAPGINVELNENGEIIGVEILKASRFSQDLEKETAKA
jgi:hypothetical protein